MDVLVVGAGAMGGWLGRVFLDTFEQAGLRSEGETTDSVDLIYYDQQYRTAESMASETGGRAVETLDDEEFDVVCVAVPIPAASSVLEEHAPRAHRAVVDVTGTMREPVESMRRHAPECERCSLHPLFAPANEPGNVPVVIDQDGPVTSALREALEARGNHVFETTPAEHDEAMETVQARAHAAILAYGLAAEPVHERFQTPVSATLFELLEQVTSGESRVYADIQSAFDGAEDVAAMATALAEADTDAFQRLYEQARPGSDRDERTRHGTAMNERNGGHR